MSFLDPTTVAAPVAVSFGTRTAAEPALGLGTTAPRLTWQVPAAPQGWIQAAYEVEVTRRRAGGDPQTDTVKVRSACQVLVPWPVAALVAYERVVVRIRVTGTDGSISGWSQPAVAEVGPLTAADWRAGFITPVAGAELADPAPVMVGRITLPEGIVSGRLHSTAHGLYQPYLNGREVGRDRLAPGWTSFDARLRWYSIDVTDRLVAGENSLEIVLGNGWYRGALGWTMTTDTYGSELAVLALLEVETADGVVWFGTDDTWTTRPSHILANDLYGGQRTDLRLPFLGDRAAEAGVRELVRSALDLLVPADGPPVRIIETVAARQVFRSPTGKVLVDFGQNVVGWLRLTLRGLAAGTEVTVRHAEVLEDGELGTRPLRNATATDTWIADGTEQTVEPIFTFHGFRYAEITGLDDLAGADVVAVVVHSDLERTGWFESSDPLLNQLHDNVVWGMRGNFVDVPTDCPQRDERLGWTGDIQVFSPTASYLFDVNGFLTSWLADLVADQADDGTIGFVIPDILRNDIPAAAWGDAGVVVPWVLYERFGNLNILQRQLDSMCAWVDRITDIAGESRLWRGGFQFGDWLDPTAPPENPALAKAHHDIVATACYAHCADLVAKASDVVGRIDLADRYGRLADEIKAAFGAAYVTPNGMIISDAPTVYAQAIVWGLLSPEQQQAAGDRLADLTRLRSFRVSTGFVGTPLITDALTLTGHLDVAYRLLLEKGCPSWLYPVTMGATTIWERWDSMLPDGSINPGQMTSFNHYALGAVADWMHRTIAGLAPVAPGYRRLRIAPRPGGGLTSASGSHQTPYGLAAVAWELNGTTLTVTADVPVGVMAEVSLPDGSASVEVGHGHHTWQTTLPDAAVRVSERSTIRELMDSAHWPQVVRIALETDGASSDLDLAARLDRSLDRPVAELQAAITLDGFVGGGKQIQERVISLLG